MDEFLANRTLLCCFIAWASAQIAKYVIDGLKHRGWSPKQILGFGGMPSSHTAAVVALAMTIGFTEGFATPFFAISALFAIIVMYDAAGVRRETGKQGKVINELLNISGPDGQQLIPEELKERIGHTPLEVIAGFIMGVLCSLLFILF